MNKSINYKIFDDINSFNNYNEVSNDKGLIASVMFNNNFTDYTIRVPYEYSVDPDVIPIENYYKSRNKNVNEKGIFFFSEDLLKSNMRNVLFHARSWEKYITTVAGKYLYIFSPVQTMVNQAILQTKTNKEIDIEIRVGKLSKSKALIDMFDEEGDMKKLHLKTLIYPLLFILQSMNIMISIIHEKEKGQEQGLLAIGVHPSTLWLSWEMFYLVLILFISLTTAVIEINSLFSSINVLLGFLFIFIYSISCFGISIILTKIFKKTKPAIFVFSLLFITLIFIGEYIYKLENQYPIILKLICILFSPIDLSVGLNKLIEDKTLGKSSGGFIIYFFLLLCSVLLYYLVIFGIEFFSFKFSNLFKRKSDFSESSYYEEDIQEDPTNCGKPLIEVKNIFKLYKKRNNHKLFNFSSSEKDSVKVLKGISFNIYNNEIFGILGHNAAGKSTLIKIMTSLLNADHGNVYYDGLELVSNVNKIRKNIGNYFILFIFYFNI